MAILNCKTGEEGFLEEWKNALRRHFNAVRMFNALAATFAERLRLLESLRVIEQDWEAALGRVIDAFVRDWERRNAECAALACEFLNRILDMREEAELDDPSRRKEMETLSSSPTIRSPLFRTPIIHAPRNVPIIDPFPPLMLVPPITVAAIAFNSNPTPRIGLAIFSRSMYIIAATPTIRPQKTKGRYAESFWQNVL